MPHSKRIQNPYDPFVMTTRATGRKKNLILTLWLCLPFAVLATILAIIFLSYGKQSMNARPVGQGAGDTGGANAIGEWLAGNDPDQQDRTARDLREGRLIDPLLWKPGLTLSIPQHQAEKSSRYLFAWDGVEPPVLHLTADPGTDASITKPASFFNAIYAKGLPGAGLYLASTARVKPEAGRLTDADGNFLSPIVLQPLPAEQAIPGQPLVVVIEPDP